MELTATLSVINDMERAGVIGSYAITGAVAALYYIEPAVTQDIDILISFDESGYGSETGLVSLQPILEYARERGYQDFTEEGLDISGWPVQFLPVASDLDAEALDRAVTVELKSQNGTEAVSTRVLAAEYIVATALRIGRPKDHVRVAQFIEEDAVDLAALKRVIVAFDLSARWIDHCRRTGLVDPLGMGASP